MTQSIRSTKIFRDGNLFRIRKNRRNLRMPQSRGFERPRRSRSQHSNPGGARCLSSASVAQMLAAASIKVMDALFGFLARNDAECCKRELLGRSWRRDWAMRKFRPKNAFLGDRKNFCGLDALGMRVRTTPVAPARPSPPENFPRHGIRILIKDLIVPQMTFAHVWTGVPSP